MSRLNLILFLEVLFVCSVQIPDLVSCFIVNTSMKNVIKNWMSSSKAYLPAIMINEAKRNPISITFTSHPTNLTFGKNSNRIKLWEEINHYTEHIPKLMANMSKNQHQEHISQLNNWVGTDMDRHQDERSGIFLYTFLKHIEAVALGYSKMNTKLQNQYKTLVSEIFEVTIYMHEMFNNGVEVNLNQFSNKLDSIAEKIRLIKNMAQHINYRLFPIDGINSHYRISSSDLQTEEGQMKILERLKQVKVISKKFGKSPISQIIIADCTTLQHISILSELLKKSELNGKINITPLIEEQLNDQVLDEILAATDNKVMIAGSDLTQRFTWVGTKIMSLKIQKKILEENKRRKQGEQIISYFEGTGSTVNRNGCLYKSRMGTILEDIIYERTVQGQQYEQFMNDKKFQEMKIDELTVAKRCTLKHVDAALPLLKRIFDEVSHLQLELQTQPNFSNAYKIEIAHKTTESQYGSRAKYSPNIQKFQIKNQRAITQSNINKQSGFHPEMCYWDSLSASTMLQIEKNIANPIIQDFLNQYTAIHQVCDLHIATDWIKDQMLDTFVSGFLAYARLMVRISEMELSEQITDNLLLCNYGDKRPVFNLEDMHEFKAKFLHTKYNTSRDPKLNQKLLKRTGCGFHTLKQIKPKYKAELL